METNNLPPALEVDEITLHFMYMCFRGHITFQQLSDFLLQQSINQANNQGASVMSSIAGMPVPNYDIDNRSVPNFQQYHHFQDSHIDTVRISDVHQMFNSGLYDGTYDTSVGSGCHYSSVSTSDNVDMYQTPFNGFQNDSFASPNFAPHVFFDRQNDEGSPNTEENDLPPYIDFSCVNNQAPVSQDSDLSNYITYDNNQSDHGSPASQDPNLIPNTISNNLDRSESESPHHPNIAYQSEPNNVSINERSSVWHHPEDPRSRNNQIPSSSHVDRDYNIESEVSDFIVISSDEEGAE